MMSLEAFKERVLPLKDKLYRFALRLLNNNKDDASDAVQDVLIKVWDKREDMHQYENMEAWCMKLTRNVCYDRFRSKSYKNSMPIPEHMEVVDEARNPEEGTELNDLVRMIRDFVNQLPEKQKLIFHLRDVEGHTYNEICDILELNLNQVRVNLHRARKSLREMLINVNAYGT